MKKVFYLCLICLMAISAPAQQSEYVDLGLPSGTLWKNANEGGDNAYYTYDQAMSRFGNKLPEKHHFVELQNECTWIRIDDYGCEVIGPNGNSITLPAAGARDCDGYEGGIGSLGRYWSSTPYDSAYAWSLYFYSGGFDVNSNGYRCYGRSVRLVLGNNDMTTDYLEEEVIYTVVEHMPEYSGGNQAMIDYINDNLRYPIDAQNKGIQGRAICQFVINKDGRVVDVQVVRSTGNSSLDNEAIRLISSMPKWKPGMQRGKPVRVKYTVPVNFRLH